VSQIISTASRIVVSVGDENGRSKIIKFEVIADCRVLTRYFPVRTNSLAQKLILYLGMCCVEDCDAAR